jgi:hypothetical protein
LYKQKNVDKLDFHRVCLHSEQSANADCFLFFNKALFVKIVVFKTKLFKVDWSGSARLLREQRAGETPQAFTPRRLTARTKESEHLEGKSTTPHYLVNSNKVCENSL